MCKILRWLNSTLIERKTTVKFWTTTESFLWSDVMYEKFSQRFQIWQLFCGLISSQLQRWLTKFCSWLKPFICVIETCKGKKVSFVTIDTFIILNIKKRNKTSTYQKTETSTTIFQILTYSNKVVRSFFCINLEKYPEKNKLNSSRSLNTLEDDIFNFNL